MPKYMEYGFDPNMYFPYYLVVPFPQIEPDGGQQGVVFVPDGPFQEVPYHPVVVLYVADDRLYPGPCPETFPGLAFLVVRLGLGIGVGNGDLGPVRPVSCP